MPTVEIRHRTSYRYDRPVELGPHRLMLWPRESRDVRIEAHTLALRPPAALAWGQDVFGNTVATGTFSVETDLLTIESSLRVCLCAHPWPVFPMAASAILYPFSYAEAERLDLGALMRPHFADDDGRVAYWTRSFVAGERTDTLALLKDLAAGVAQLHYCERHEEGTRAPAATLARGSGSCRDFATLFADAARRLGFGARLVSGYLFQPTLAWAGADAAGSMHAWAEVFVPGAGWIAFDPTNRAVGGANLVPVAVARDLEQIAPVSGKYAGAAATFEDLTVQVSVHEVGSS